MNKWQVDNRSDKRGKSITHYRMTMSRVLTFQIKCTRLIHQMVIAVQNPTHIKWILVARFFEHSTKHVFTLVEFYSAQNFSLTLTVNYTVTVAFFHLISITEQNSVKWNTRISVHSALVVNILPNWNKNTVRSSTKHPLLR